MLIGVTGNKRHGKDSIANILRKNFYYTIAKFAGALKNSSAMVYGNDPNLHELDKTKDTIDPNWGISYRDEDIELGQKYREIRPDHWVRRLEIDLQQLAKSTGAVTICKLNVVISDLRFVNEAEFIQHHNGYIIRVINPRVGRPTGVTDSGWAVSETEQFNIKEDATIYNDGTLLDLETKVDEVMSLFRQDLLRELQEQL